MQNEKRILALLLGALISVRDNENLRETGICDGVKDALINADIHYFSDEYHDTVLLIRQYTRQWPKWSGSGLFPVPDPLGGSPGAAYMKAAAGYYSFWDRREPYARLRWELLEWLIFTVQQDFNDHEDSSSA